MISETLNWKNNKANIKDSVKSLKHKGAETVSLLSCAAQVLEPFLTQMCFPLQPFQAAEPCVPGLVKTQQRP